MCTCHSCICLHLNNSLASRSLSLSPSLPAQLPLVPLISRPSAATSASSPVHFAVSSSFKPFFICDARSAIASGYRISWWASESPSLTHHNHLRTHMHLHVHIHMMNNFYTVSHALLLLLRVSEREFHFNYATHLNSQLSDYSPPLTCRRGTNLFIYPSFPPLSPFTRSHRLSLDNCITVKSG